MLLNLIYDGRGTLLHVQPGELTTQNALALLTELTEYGS